METPLHDDHGRRFDPLAMSMQARELQGRLVGFGSGVCEECPVHARYRAKPLAEGLLLAVLVPIGDMDDAPGLGADRLDDRRMGMTEAIDGDAGESVQIAAASLVPEPRPFTMREGDGESPVGCHEIVFGWHRAPKI